MPAGTQPDLAALRQRYAAERDKRMRPADGAGQPGLGNYLAPFLADPFARPRSRPAVHDHVSVTVVGAGFGGLLAAARLSEIGLDDLRIVDRADGFGGTWYWNRYPGAQCDTASMIYLPLLEETGYRPTERYARAPEILAYCNRIAARYSLENQALFQTGVTDLEWDANRTRWIVRTDRGDEFTSWLVVIAPGALHVPKLPAIPGIETFGGHSFHTSRWDYAYTGGDPDGAPMDRLANKRVAIIGTGATAVQCIPALAGACRELLVFQRTPASVDGRGNQPIDPQWFASVAMPGWQERWLDNFCAVMSVSETPPQDLVDDAWTDLARRIAARLKMPRSEPLGMAGVQAEIEAVDAEKMNEIRARVDAVVRDPATGQQLKPWYRQLCKRPCFHDDYLSAYNLPSVQLIGNNGKGAEIITPGAVVAAGIRYPADCIIYASGFEADTEPTGRYGFDLTGRDGIRLSDYWAGGMRSLHGIHVHGFPNVFFVQLAQGAGFLANVPHNLADSARTVAAVVSHLRAGGRGEVDAIAEAEDAWVRQVTPAPQATAFLAQCTPSYYNNAGRGPATWPVLSGYQRGPLNYFRYLDRWRQSGDFKGLAFRQ
jgi:cation diffusion facilitator CzcD-associated flavoprotein CzcO